MKLTNRCDQIIAEIDNCLLEQERAVAEAHQLVEQNGTDVSEEELIYGAVKSGWINPPK